MRNLTFFVLAIFMATNINAQKGVKIGLHFIPGSSMALNTEDFDRGEDLNFSGAFAFNVGFTAGYGFNDKIALMTGVMFNNHVSAYVHDRQYANGTGGALDVHHKKKFSRTLGYIRVPVLLQIGSTSDEESGGFFFRFGPHFDLLTGGKYQDQRLEGYSKYNIEKGIDLTGETNIWEPSTDKTSASRGSAMGKIYNEIVVGLSLEIGGKIHLADNFNMIIALHLETSLTNPEGTGAASFANNMIGEVTDGSWGQILGADFYVPTSASGADAAKYLSESQVFRATYPNYTNPNQIGATHRDPTFNVFGGLTFGFQYTISTDY